jgi:hypothetical protein
MATRAEGNRYSVTLTRKSIGFALLAGASVLLAGFVAVPFFSREQFLRHLKQWANRPGRALHVETESTGMGPRVPKRIRLALGPGATLEAENPQLSLSWGRSVAAVVDKAQLSVRGTPSSLWEQWVNCDDRRTFPLTIRNLVIDYQDASVGQVFAQGVHTETRDNQLMLAAHELTFNQLSWKDVTLTIARPKTAIVVQMGEAVTPTKPIEFRYVPSQGVAAEWFLDVPSRPLSLLLDKLGAGHARSDLRTRVTGVITVTIPDDSKKAAHANGQFVLDDWFLPKWPEAKAIAGNSGAIGVRMQPGRTAGRWELSRVEVSAGVFTLVGTGKLDFGALTHLTSETKGSLNCDQLAAHLPASRYRDLVRGYLKSGVVRNTSAVATSVEAESVELGLAIDLAAGVAGYSTVSWHLSAGCGLNELSSEDSVSSGSAP